MLLHSSKPWGLRRPVPVAPARCPQGPRPAPAAVRPVLASHRIQPVCPHVLLSQLAHHAQQRRRVMVAARGSGPGDLDDELGEDDDNAFDFAEDEDEFEDELLDALADDNPDELDANGLAADSNDEDLLNFFGEQGLLEDELMDDQGHEFDDETGQQPGDGESGTPRAGPLLLAHLFQNAAFYDVVDMLDKTYPDVVINGLQSDASRVAPGDMYCCTWPVIEDIPGLVRRALQQGAAALLLPAVVQDDEEVKRLVPPSMPVFFVEDVEEAATRFGVAFYQAPSRDMLMVGLVGTHGKTTTAWLIRGILEEMEQTAGMLGSIENAIAEERLDEDGAVWQASEPDNTSSRDCSAPFMITPYQGKYHLPSSGLNGLQVQKVLSGIRDKGATCCLFEASPENLVNRRLAWVEVSVAVHTCVLGHPATSLQSREERDQDLSALASAVLEPFERLVDPETQLAVINIDDPAAPVIRAAARAVPAITYSYSNPEADVVCESATYDIWESEVIIRTPLGRLQIISSLLGEHNVRNILAAVATGIALKVPLKSIVAGIEAVEVIPGRCEIVDEGQDFSVVVDAADNPQALSNMLRSFSEREGRIITVFGCKGEEGDKTERAMMAEVAHQLSDIVIITNDSPRREQPQEIVEEIVAGLPETVTKPFNGYVFYPFQDQGHVPLWFEPHLQQAQRVAKRYIMEDRFSAIRAAIGTAAAGDVVVLAGRGHSDCMEYGDEEGEIIRGWFDDRVEARSALGKLAYLNQLTLLSRRNLPWERTSGSTALMRPLDPEDLQDDDDESLLGATL